MLIGFVTRFAHQFIAVMEQVNVPPIALMTPHVNLTTYPALLMSVHLQNALWMN